MFLHSFLIFLPFLCCLSTGFILPATGSSNFNHHRLWRQPARFHNSNYSACSSTGAERSQESPLRSTNINEVPRLPCIGPHRSLGTDRCLDFNSRYLKRSERWYRPAIQYLSQIMCSTIFGFFMKVMNRFHHHRLSTLHDLVYNRPPGKGLLTVCNHQSMADDPGLWPAILPLWKTRPSKMRWTICTEDVYFSHPILTNLLQLGQVIPLDRNGSRDQPLFQRFFEVIQNGNWGHIYIEGRVWQNWRFKKEEIHLGPIKTGVGKLIAHAYPNDPIVLPFFHTGMDKILPERILNETDQQVGLPSKPAVKIPQMGNDIYLYVGKPMNFHEKLKQFDEQHPGLLKKTWYSTKETTNLYREIALDIEQEMISLEYEAYGRTSPARPFFLSQRRFDNKNS